MNILVIIIISITGSVPLGSIADFNPEFPGVALSKYCAEKVVDSNGATITGEGIRLTVPQYAIQPGDSVTIALQACLDGPFVLPDDTVLVSPVYRIAPPCIFRQDVILTIEHFAELETLEDCNEIVFITSPTKPKLRPHKEEAYWKFKNLHIKPECKPKSQRGNIYLSHFCLGALGRRLTRRGNYALVHNEKACDVYNVTFQISDIATVQVCTPH